MGKVLNFLFGLSLATNALFAQEFIQKRENLTPHIDRYWVGNLDNKITFQEYKDSISIANIPVYAVIDSKLIEKIGSMEKVEDKLDSIFTGVNMLFDLAYQDNDDVSNFIFRFNYEGIVDTINTREGIEGYLDADRMIGIMESTYPKAFMVYFTGYDLVYRERLNYIRDKRVFLDWSNGFEIETVEYAEMGGYMCVVEYDNNDGLILSEGYSFLRKNCTTTTHELMHLLGAEHDIAKINYSYMGVDGSLCKDYGNIMSKGGWSHKTSKETVLEMNEGFSARFTAH